MLFKSRRGPRQRCRPFYLVMSTDSFKGLPNDASKMRLIQKYRILNLRYRSSRMRQGCAIMEKDPHRSKMRPDTVKYGIIFLFCGWLCHYVFYFSKFSEEMPLKTTLLQLGVGIGICYFVATLKRWARMLCLFFNIGIIGLYTLYCLAYFQSNLYSLMLLTGLIVVFFAISTYFLLKKETAQFYAAATPSVGRQEPSDN